MNVIPTSQKQVIILNFILPSSLSFDRTALQTIHTVVIGMKPVSILVLDGKSALIIFSYTYKQLMVGIVTSTEF